MKVGLLSLRVVPQQQCNGQCPCDSAQARQLKQRSALVAVQWRGDTALTLPLFWRWSTVSPVFFGRYPRSSLHSFVPFPVPNKPPRFCGRKAKWSCPFSGEPSLAEFGRMCKEAMFGVWKRTYPPCSMRNALASDFLLVRY